MHMLGLNCIL